jgi:hypothetical protein
MLFMSSAIAIMIMLVTFTTFSNNSAAFASEEDDSSNGGENTISCGEPLTVITKKHRDAEIPPVARAIVNDETKNFQCEESEGDKDKIKLKEGDKVTVIAQNGRVELQADGIFFFEEGNFFRDRVFVDTAERISDQEIKFEVPDDIDKDIDSIIFNGLLRGDEDDRIDYISNNVKVRG